MYLDAKPIIRYPIAATLLVLGAVALHYIPAMQPIIILLYALLVGIYARELALGIIWMIVITVAFKFLAKLPLFVLIFGGVIVLLFVGF